MKNAPLIEIIAELRWAAGRSGSPLSVQFGGDESQYVRFGISIGKEGYDRLERIQPQGMPTQAGTVVYRYRRGDEQQNTLFQLGPGVFTANGLPPYNSWREFEPVIRAGLGALYAVNAFDQKEPIELVLRYMDAFTAEILGPVSRQEFVESIVGVGYRVTDAVAKFAGKAELHAMRFNAVHEAPSGGKVIIDIGDGEKEGESVLVMNTSAFSPQFVAQDVDQVMQEYGRLQDVLHEMFFEMLKRKPELHERLVKSGA